MLTRGSIVRLTKAGQRRTREQDVDTAILICDPYIEQGNLVCALGFFTSKYGPWVKKVLVTEVAEATGVAELPVAITQRSYQPEYRIWMNMRRRCSDPRNQGFHSYTNRAKVCPEWETSFDQFFADMGSRPTPNHSLDRVNNEGDYEPGNVRWATAKEQARNTSKTRFVTAQGQTKPLTQWAEELGISAPALEYRLKHWDADTAVSRPRDQRTPYIEAHLSQRKRGEQQHLAKITENDVRAIRIAHTHGETNKSIAKRYCLAETNVSYIVRKITWKHVKDD